MILQRILWLKNKGFETESQYRECLAKRNGFKNDNERRRLDDYKKGKHLPMEISKNSPVYLGVYIAENILPDIFDNPKMMPYGNKGYDSICKNGYKIDVKSSIYQECNNRWKFAINHNKITDYFLLIAFNNRQHLDVLHIWLIKNDELINNKNILNEYDSLIITNNNKRLKEFTKYELLDKIDKVKNICDMFKNRDHINKGV